MNRALMAMAAGLFLLMGPGCGSDNGTTEPDEVADPGGGSDNGTTEPDVVADPGGGTDEGPGTDTNVGNACHACVLAGEGMALRFTMMDVTEPSIPDGLPEFLNNIWGPDLAAFRLNVILRLDKVTDQGDGTLKVDVTAGAGWHDLTAADITPIVHDKVPTKFNFVEGFTTTFHATIDENCTFQTDDNASLWFHPGPLDRALVCSAGDDTIGLPKDTIPIANLDAMGTFDAECKNIFDGEMTGCIAADAACQICNFILAPNYENWALNADPAVTPENCQASYCNHHCGKGDGGMPLWANFGGFVEAIGVPKTCDVNGPESGYGLVGNWEAELITMEAN